MSSISSVSEQVLFAGIFLALVTIIHEVTKRVRIPFTVALLLLGFVVRYLVDSLGLTLPVSLSPDFIYFVLLPLLLFGAAMHINLHQFRLQFRTISFISTFGLLIGVMVVGAGVSLFAGLPIWDALMFGALISATDPIAVLSIFQQLGAPRRLALLADGESMFNDATAVIFFRILAGVVFAGKEISTNLFVAGFGEFLYVFVGSILAGAAVGYVISQLIAWIQDDPLVETTLTLVAALMAFVAMEHYLHLSGVICAVVSGLVMGNWGRARFSPSVIEFVRLFWDYLGFLAVAIVFFFSAVDLDFRIFLLQPMRLAIVVGVVLVARAVSVYSTFYITNRSMIFGREPGVPMSWQHILNWGGLRGVIPLVLVFSLPHDYIYREDILAFTLSTFIFTLIVNGMTIEWLLKKLKLHQPRIEEAIIKEEDDIFWAEEVRAKLKVLPDNEFATRLISLADQRIATEIAEHENALRKHAKHNPRLLELSLRLQAVILQKKMVQRLFREGQISEDILFDLETQFDLRADALEYPEIFEVRVLKTKNEGEVRFLDKLEKLQHKERQASGIWRRILRASWEDLVIERYGLLRARAMTAQEVVGYIERVELVLGQALGSSAVVIKKEYEQYIKENRNRKQLLEKKYLGLITLYREQILNRLIEHRPVEKHHE